MKIRIDPLYGKPKLLKFSNSCLKRFHKCLMFMLPTRYGKKILWSVVFSDSIQVMYDPPHGNRFTVVFFPDYQMLSDISRGVCPRVARFENKNVSIVGALATIPFMMICASRSIFEPIFRVSCTSYYKSLFSIAVRYTTFLKQLVQPCALARITQAFLNFSNRKTLIPMQIKKFFSFDVIRYIYPSRHIFIITYIYEHCKYVEGGGYYSH